MLHIINNLSCPSCSNDLLPETHLGYALLEYPSCKSILISSDQVGPYLSEYAKQSHIPEQKIEFEKNVINKFIHTEPPKPCPKCNNPTLLFNYRYDSNIFLNKCQNCSLIYIEGQEIESLATIVKGNTKFRELGKILLDIENEKIERQSQSNIIPTPFVLTYTPIVISNAQPRQKPHMLRSQLLQSAPAFLFPNLYSSLITKHISHSMVSPRQISISQLSFPRFFCMAAYFIY
mgnify:CR=1 FL=1